MGKTSSTKPRFFAASNTPAMPATGTPLCLATARHFRSSINRNLQFTSSANTIASASPRSSMSTSSDKDEVQRPEGSLIYNHPCSMASASCSEPGRPDPRHNSVCTAGGYRLPDIATAAVADTRPSQARSAAQYLQQRSLSQCNSHLIIKFFRWIIHCGDTRFLKEFYECFKG